MEKAFQCCYTNLSTEEGDKVVSGWQSVAVSESIPSDARENCINYQNINSFIQNAMLDEKGNDLDLFEITGDGNYLYVMRSKYGSTDRLGRPNMFSHAFVFPCSDRDFIADPNKFLSIDDNCFRSTVEDAQAHIEEIEYISGMDLKTALQESGISKEKYELMIKCVYAQYSDKKLGEPLYIQYDGSEADMKRILFCIYSGLPYAVRRRLNIASCKANQPESRNLIFSVHAQDQHYYLIPATGANNILTGRVERRMDKYGFVSYKAKNPEDCDDYFVKLEETAELLGDTAAADDITLKIAHSMVVSNGSVEAASDAELEEWISDALRSRSYDSKLLNEYIVNVLLEINKRGMTLTEENEANLRSRASASDDPIFQYSVKTYIFNQFDKLSAEDAVKFLSERTKDELDLYRTHLMENAEGKAILDSFYAGYCLSDNTGWDELVEFIDESNKLGADNKKSKQKAAEKAIELYESDLKKGADPIDEYDLFMDTVNRAFGGEDTQQYSDKAKIIYWNFVKIEDFPENAPADNVFAELGLNSVRFKILEALKVILAKMDTDITDDERLKFINSFANVPSVKTDKEIYQSIVQVFKNKTEVARNNPDMIVCALKAEKPDFMRLLEFKAEAKKHQFEDLLDVQNYFFEKFTEDARSFEELKRPILKIMSSDLEKADQNEDAVPLNNWLLLGRSKYRNAFEIFDEEYKPGILFVPAEEAVTNDSLLKKDAYARKAEDYISSKGSEAKTVKKWISIARTGDKTGHESDVKNVLSGLFSKLQKDRKK